MRCFHFRRPQMVEYRQFHRAQSEMYQEHSKCFYVSSHLALTTPQGRHSTEDTEAQRGRLTVSTGLLSSLSGGFLTDPGYSLPEINKNQGTDVPTGNPIPPPTEGGIGRLMLQPLVLGGRKGDKPEACSTWFLRGPPAGWSLSCPICNLPIDVYP